MDARGPLPSSPSSRYLAVTYQERVGHYVFIPFFGVGNTFFGGGQHLFTLWLRGATNSGSALAPALATPLAYWGIRVQ